MDFFIVTVKGLNSYDFTLFEEVPEFYACYKMLNVKNHHVFNEKFVLNVLDLKRIDLATEEDRRYEIDCWARMFKAGTWEHDSREEQIHE